MRNRILIVMLLCFLKSFSQDTNFLIQDIAINNLIDGTLLIPNEVEKPNLVIIIGGSGPTDRNGNQSFLKNNSLKKLAEELSSNKIATFRYDKRIVKQIKQGNIDRSSAFFMKMKKRMIRPLRVSKYCVGIMKFHPASELKQNRFKKKNLSINKIIC
mgnify:CR=1 FL=1